MWQTNFASIIGTEIIASRWYDAGSLTGKWSSDAAGSPPANEAVAKCNGSGKCWKSSGNYVAGKHGWRLNKGCVRSVWEREEKAFVEWESS